MGMHVFKRINLLPANNFMICKALETSTFEPDTQVAVAGVILGMVMGIGAPVFYASRDEADEKCLQEIRALNRATKEATGEYMSEQELYTIRPPRWTDRSIKFFNKFKIRFN